MKYNDGIIEHQISIIDAIDSLENSFSDYKMEHMNTKYVILQQKVDSSIHFLDGLSDFEGDSALLISARSLFGNYKQVTENNYPVIIEILSMPDSVFTEKDQQRLFDQQSIVNDQISKAHQDFLNEQNDFGKRHNLVFTAE